MYLEHLQIPLQCAVHPQRPAMVDSTLRAFVNWEVFFFSDAKAKRSFEKKPYEYCGSVTDPVSQARFTPRRRSPRTEFNGRLYYFESKANRTAFLCDPGKYAIRTGM
jgi:YHS domain-containing protein